MRGIKLILQLTFNYLPYLVVKVVFVDVIFMNDKLNKAPDSVNMNRFKFSGLVTSLLVV